jgi:predicted MFS family arabinose efflux permease
MLTPDAARWVTQPATPGYATGCASSPDIRPLRPLVAAGFLNSMAFGGVAGLLVVYAIRNLGVPAHGAGIGALLAVISIGGLLASLTFGRIFEPARVRNLTVAAAATSTVTTAALALTHPVPAADILLLVYALALPVTTMAGIVYRQTVTPEQLRSRVMTAGRMIAWGGQPLGAALAGIVAQLSGVTAAYLLCSAAFAGACIVATRTQHSAG